MKQRQTLGRRGEKLAAQYLQRNGMEVVDSNWRCARGELDLVAFDGPIIAAVEVKTRRSQHYGHPFEAITEAKLNRLYTLAVLWARHYGYYTAPLRVDAVAVLCEDSESPKIEHLRGVYR